MARVTTTFEEFVVDRGPDLLRLGYVLTSDAALAEDLVQEALIKVHRRWDRGIHAEHPDAYVRRIVLNEYLSWRRRARSREAPQPLPDTVWADGADQRAESDLVWRVLSTLSRRQRAVLVLRYYEDLADAEIATTLGCSEGTVRSNAARAFAVLRRHPQLDPSSIATRGQIVRTVRAERSSHETD